MILSVTPNSALDRVIFIEEFRPGAVMRAPRTVEAVGGKGLDASVVLAAFGVETVGMTFAAGPIGERLASLLERCGVIPEIVWVGGETRIAHVIVETLHGRHSHIMTGALRVAPADYAELLRRFRARLAAGVTWVVAGGSLPAGAPPDFYRTLAAEAGQAAVPFLLDSVGAPALAALCGRPTILKLNRAEFAATFANAVATVADLRRAAQAVLSQHALPALVLTLGREGILAITPDHAYLVAAPVQQEVNAAGSGDAVSAALAWRFLLGDDWRAALRWAAAAGAATVLTEGTAECRMADVLRILPETTIQELP